jgi:GAF domain-containing protein
MDENNPFSRELRSALDRIAELQRRSDADPASGGRLLPEALAGLNMAIEELSVTGEELRAQSDELASTRRALEAERQRYQELRWLLRRLGPQETARPVLAAEHALAQDDARRSHLEALDPAADLDGTVQVLMDEGVRLLGVDGIGLMLADTQGRLCAAGGSDEPAMAFLRAQEHAIKGPSVHAFLLERPVQAADLTGDARWAPLADAATVHGVGAAIAAPIGLFGGPVGACLLISRRPRRWADGDLTAAEAFAAVLAALLELAAEVQRSSGLSRRLQDLVHGQAVVEQAKGALMASKGIDAEAATVQLRQLARRSGRPPAEVAASLLRRLEAGPR